MRRIASLVVVVLLTAGGCAPWATYPPDEGGMNLSGPRTEPVPTLMVESLMVMKDQADVGTEYAVNLPPGTPAQVYDWVLGRVGSGHPMLDPSELTFHVTKVRVRGRQAQVDVFYPEGGDYAFATLSFTGDMMVGYTLDGTRIWHTRETPPPPGYVPIVADQGEQPPLARESDG